MEYRGVRVGVEDSHVERGPLQLGGYSSSTSSADHEEEEQCREEFQSSPRFDDGRTKGRRCHRRRRLCPGGYRTSRRCTRDERTGGGSPDGGRGTGQVVQHDSCGPRGEGPDGSIIVVIIVVVPVVGETRRAVYRRGSRSGSDPDSSSILSRECSWGGGGHTNHGMDLLWPSHPPGHP